MNKIPFYIGMILSCFVKSGKARARLRGKVNCFLYSRAMSKFIKQKFGVKTENIKFVRQHTMGRCVCVINNKYFVKIFRNMTISKLKNFEFLVNYVKNFLNITIPKVYVSDNGYMYVTEMINGRGIYDFDKKYVLKHEQKIISQIEKLISNLQSIDLSKISNAERFTVALEATSKNTHAEPLTSDSVLVHGDMNIRNFLFDEDMNICGLIDFDSLAISNDKTKDIQVFMKYWNRYKNK